MGYEYLIASLPELKVTDGKVGRFDLVPDVVKDGVKVPGAVAFLDVGEDLLVDEVVTGGEEGDLGRLSFDRRLRDFLCYCSLCGFYQYFGEKSLFNHF